MERLTQRDENNVAYWCGINGKSSSDIKGNIYGEAITKLADYEDAEEQGLIVKLPCPIGSTIWFVGNEFVNDYEVRRYIVDETGIDCVQIAKEIDGRDYWNSFSIDDFGKTVFLTKEEAEQALAEMKGV